MIIGFAVYEPNRITHYEVEPSPEGHERTLCGRSVVKGTWRREARMPLNERWFCVSCTRINAARPQPIAMANAFFGASSRTPAAR